MAGNGIERTLGRMEATLESMKEAQRARFEEVDRRFVALETSIGKRITLLENKWERIFSNGGMNYQKGRLLIGKKEIGGGAIVAGVLTLVAEALRQWT